MRIERKKKEDKPVLAFCYDFDKTLSPNDMQAQGYIQAVYQGDVTSFWKESNELAEENGMDTNLAWMYMMLKLAHGKIVLNRTSLKEYGAKVALFPGVENWFERIREYGKERGIIVEHYIISSGLKEMIEGTVMAKAGAFEQIYASSFKFDKAGVPEWPAQAINYTNKTQFLFRVQKGVLDVNDSGVNDYFRPEEIRVPFRNIVYIGDSDTDIPCMKLVNTNGGHSIGVYNPETTDKAKVYKMLNDNRIKYFAAADYSDGSELDEIVKDIINRTAENEKLEAHHYKCLQELRENDRATNEEKQREKRTNLILSLSSSRSFLTTHAVVKELALVDNWSSDEIDWLLKVALSNKQVRYILKDLDISLFFGKILDTLEKETEDSKIVKAEIARTE